MRTLALVVLLAAVGCGAGSSPEPVAQPDIDQLFTVTGTDLRCDNAAVVAYPVDAPTSVSCTWSCVSHWGADALTIKVVFTRPSAADPWPATFQDYFATPGTCR